MTLAQELGKAFVKSYKAQDQLGPNYLSSLIWDAWIGKPENPDDPVPYIQTLLPKDCISLEADPRVTALSKTEQEALYDEATDVMWAEIQAS